MPLKTDRQPENNGEVDEQLGGVPIENVIVVDSEQSKSFVDAIVRSIYSDASSEVIDAIYTYSLHGASPLMASHLAIVANRKQLQTAKEIEEYVEVKPDEWNQKTYLTFYELYLKSR